MKCLESKEHKMIFLFSIIGILILFFGVGIGITITKHKLSNNKIQNKRNSKEILDNNQRKVIIMYNNNKIISKNNKNMKQEAYILEKFKNEYHKCIKANISQEDLTQLQNIVSNKIKQGDVIKKPIISKHKNIQKKIILELLLTKSGPNDNTISTQRKLNYCFIEAKDKFNKEENHIIKNGRLKMNLNQSMSLLYNI